MFKSHLEMIGRNETPSKKAKFWQSYVRSLKGSEDIRAHETPRPRSYRPYSALVDLPTHWKSIFDEPATPAERIASHGYRYLPVHRETYGYSPRPIYDHHYSRSIPYNEYLNYLELPWDCNELKRLRKLRNEALKEYKKTNKPTHYNIFLNLNKELKRTNKDSYINYIRETKLNKIPEGTDPQTYWNFVQLIRFPSATADIERAWNEHLKRMADIERRYPSRYGLYLKDKPNALVPLEYEPEDKPLFSESARAPSVAPRFSRSPSPFSRATSVPPLRASSLEPSPLSRLRASSLEPLDRFIASKFDVPLNSRPRSMSPTPVKPGRWAPRQTEIAYDSDGLPIYHPALRRGNFGRLLNPSPYLPLSAITRDPWWWDLEDLHPFRAHLPYTHLPPLLRDSYLSPVKRRYLWRAHPMRPFAHVY